MFLYKKTSYSSLVLVGAKYLLLILNSEQFLDEFL